ncbi:MAG: rod shape-determining protein MreC [Bryobacteraceae bacterium]
MEALLSRYRNLTVLLIVVVAQLLYVAYQVRSSRDERLIRVWAVSAVTPMAGVVEAVRRNTIGFLQDYFILLDVREQNRMLKAENDRLRMANIYYHNQLATAQNARALVLFQEQSPSKTVAARVIGNSTVGTANAVFIDRGSASGVEKGMAVVTPEGVVGKIIAAYPLVSQVLLITDPTFKVGIESQKGHVHGILDCGSGTCTVEQIQNEDKVDMGEWFFTSGEDRVFPRVFPVGTVISAEPGQGMKNVKLNLSGSPAAAEEVLVVLHGVHQQIPDAPPVRQAVVAPLPPPPAENAASSNGTPGPQTQADKVLEKYDMIGKQEDHVYGAPGSNIPNFNLKPADPAAATAASTAAKQRVSTIASPFTGVLGAPRAPSKPAPALSGAKSAVSGGSVLPLGAPRRKAVPAPPPLSGHRTTGSHPSPAQQ